MAEPCDTGTPEAPCQGCPDCRAINYDLPDETMSDADLLAIFDAALDSRPEREPLQVSEAAALRVVYDRGRAAGRATAPTTGIVPPHVLDRIKGHEGDRPNLD